MNQQRISWSIASHYISIFWLIGFALIFWPTWLSSRGYTGSEIGIILAVAFWAKIPFNLLLGPLADMTGLRRRWIVLLAIIVAVGMPAFLPVSPYPFVLLLWGIVGAALTVSIPMTDNLSVLARRNPNFDYGKVRLWGSLSFIIASLVGGLVLKWYSTDSILYLMLAGAGLLLVTSLLLPDLRVTEKPVRKYAMIEALKLPGYKSCILIAALLQSSHAVLYGFASIHWQAAGLSGTSIGLLWSEGVTVEIIIFYFAKRFVHHLSFEQLFLLAALAGIIRWTGTALTTELWALILLQALHGATFALTHLAVFEYISHQVPSRLTASAQTLYDLAGGAIIFGLVMSMAGYFYHLWAGKAFFTMTLLSVLALGVLLARVRARYSDKFDQ